MNNSAWIGVGAVALWLFSKAHTGQSLQFLPLGASWSGGALQIDVGVQNPTNDSLQLTSLAGTVYVNGTAVGNVSDFTPQLIAANQQTAIRLTYTPSIFGTAIAVLNQLSTGGSIVVALRGAGNVNGISLPVNLTFQLMTP